MAKAVVSQTGHFSSGGLFASLIHPDDKDKLAARIRGMSKPSSAVDTLRITDLDGQNRTVRAFSRSEWGHVENRIVRVVGAVQDVTRHIEDHAKLQRSEALLSSVYDNAGIGVVLHAKDGYTRIRVNPAFCKMVGYTKDHLLNERYEILTDPDDLGRSLNLRRQLFDGKIENFNIEKRYIHSDGHKVWGNVYSTVIREEDGKVANYVSFIEDITRRKEAEVRLRESDRKYRNLIEGSIQGMQISAANQDILFCNDALANMLGYEDVEAIMALKTSFAFVAPYETPRLDKVTRIRVNGGDVPPEDELDVVRKDGEIIRVQTLSRRILWENQAAIQTAFIDITERKRAERELIEAKEQAELANRSKTEFLANVSHELRTPLNAIIGFSEVIKAELFGPIGNDRYEEYLGHIFDSGNHLLRIIKDILDVSKVEVGALEITPENLNVEETISASVQIVSERLQNAVLEVKIEVGDDVPDIYADVVRVKQVLLNLLSNAIKFTEPGGEICIAASIDDELVRISVADTGIGIPVEKQSLMFHPFVQETGSYHLAHEGTGLGLTLVKSLVELMGGRVAIESELGKGTCVSAWLPSVKS